MFDSKPLRQFKERSKLYYWWINTDISNYYYDFIHAIKKPYRAVKKLWEWHFNVFKNDYDFDGHSLFAIIEYKLKRVEKCLVDGHAIQEPRDLKAIKLAIKLAGRLKKDEVYEMKVFDRMEKKWGEWKSWTTPVEGKTSFRMHSKYEKQTKENESLIWEEKLELYRLAEIKMQREERWLYAILLKYLRRFWD